jgi:hypothetical protein
LQSDDQIANHRPIHYGGHVPLGRRATCPVPR